MSVLRKQVRVVTSVLNKVKLTSLKSSSPKLTLSQLRFHQTWVNMPTSANHPPRTITISVDGNISSGKSTLVANLETLFPNNFNFQVELIPEPLEKWTNLKGHNLLGMFYDDPVKNNFMFQHYVQLSRLMETIKPSEQKQKDGHKGIVRIMERSLQNNRYCFIELARREGRLQEAEFAVLSEWHDWMEKKFDLNLDLIIYLRTKPEMVYERMQRRAREEESAVPLEYLKSLHETYEDWLIRGKLGLSPNSGATSESTKSTSNINGTNRQKVIVVDANQGMEAVAAECSSFLSAYMTEIGCEVTDADRNTSPTNQKEHNGNGIHELT